MRVQRRALLKRALGTTGVLLLAACAPAAPAAAPTSAPAPKPTTAPTSSTAPTAAAAPSPAAGASPATKAPAQQNVETATFGAVVSMNYVPTFVGVEKGIFLKHGLDLKVRLLGTGQEANRALQAGETQYTGAAASNAPPAYEQGITFMNTVTVQNDATVAYSDSPLSLHAHRDAGIGPGEFAKLKGKKIGLSAGSTGEQYMRAVMAKHGIGANDLTIVNLPSSNWKSALESKQVDVISAWEPFGTQMSQVPGAVRIVRGGGYIGYSISFSPSLKLYQENPGMVERSVYAMAEAAWYTRKNQQEAAEIATRWLEGLDTATALESLKSMPFDPRLSKYTVQSWEETMKQLVEEKKLRAVIPTEKLFDTKFIDKAQREQPEWFADLKPIA